VRNGWARRDLLLQEHVIHAVVVVVVVLAATVLRAMNHLDNGTTSIVYGTAIGYAAGRSGSRSVPTRREDRDG
jgi:hypothetical protein